MRLAILGASGHGKVVADTALQSGWNEVVFFDDTWPELAKNGVWSVVGNSLALHRCLDEFDGIVVGIGDNRIRLVRTRELIAAGAGLATIIHPSSVVSTQVYIGKGSVVFAGAVVQINSQIGDACIVNTCASIDHDCQLADGVHISPGVRIAGSVTVGEASWIGIGASVKQLTRIGCGVTVGAGSVVINDIADYQTVVGNPARPLIKKTTHLPFDVNVGGLIRDESSFTEKDAKPLNWTARILRRLSRSAGRLARR